MNTYQISKAECFSKLYSNKINHKINHIQLQYLKLNFFVISKQKYKLAEMKETPTPSAGQENSRIAYGITNQ